MSRLLARIDAWDPVGNAAVSLYACSHDDPEMCHAGDGTWWPALSRLPTLRYDFFDGAFGGQITAPSSSLALQTEAWPDFGRYALADARIRLWLGSNPTAEPLFDGRVTAQPKVEGATAEIEFAVDDRWLDKALLDTYDGTTGAEGPAAVKGQAKPLALGRPRYVAGKLIDSVNNVFQVSAYGPVAAEAALERLVRFGPSSGNYASYAALVAADIPAGRWATANAVGMARFGAPTEGQVSFLIEGDKGGPDGWARKPGQLIRRLALLAGGAGKIDDASLNALDVARPYNLSINIEQQTTARELIQRIAASVNAVAGVTWAGKLFVVPIELTAANLMLAADGSSLPPVRSVQQMPIDPPWRKLVISAERTWTVHALSEIAFTAPLLPLGLFRPTTTYREGNIVTLEDGSEWLYINPVPSAGHVPPHDAPPDANGNVSDAWWFRQSPATTGAPVTWPDIVDSDPTHPKPQDGATVGAPPGTPVGDRDAKEVVEQIDFNADTMLEQILRGDGFQALLAARTLVDGVGVNTVITQFKAEQTTENTANAQRWNLLGAEADGGASFILNAEAVRVTPTETLATKLDTISTSLNGQTASLEELREIVIDPSGATVRAVMKLDVNGNVSGLIQTNNGTESEAAFLVDIFRIVDPNGGSPITPFLVEDGVVKMPNVEVDKLKVGAMDIEFQQKQAISATQGSQMLPGGVVMKWGKFRQNINDEVQLTVTFDEPFPTECQSFVPVPYITTFSAFRDLWLQNVGEPTRFGATVATQSSTSNAQSINGFDWIAFGI